MQLAELREYAGRRGWEIVDEFTDQGVSGCRESRPALNRLMSGACRRRFDAILVWKIDRFGRSLKHLVNALAELAALGVVFISLRDNLDLSTPSGRLMFQIIGAMAEFERALIQERVRAGLRNARAKGRRLGRPRVIVDASRIATLRTQGRSWAQIKTEDWSLVSRDTFQSSWPHRLWAMERHYHYLGGSGGYGEGYNAPAAVGAALANRALGRFSVNIQPDGDLMYAPGVLWTAVHHKIPLLSVMHNNRAYHQEVMHVQRMANRRDRVLNDGPIGTEINAPYIDYARLAQSMGMYAIGPIEDPKDLAPALKRAVQVVKAGEPALVDAVTQPR